MNLKKIVFIGSIVGSLILYLLFNSVDTGLCKIYCGDAIDQYQNVFLFFPLILLFSLLTYKMPGDVFAYWWKFSRVAIPVIFGISLLINLGLHHTPGGFMNMDNMFDVPALIFMYLVFTIGSIVQIIRGLRH
jgi:hypothetical protein